MRKAIALGSITAASILGGAAAGAVINQVSSAGAVDSTTTTTSPDGTSDGSADAAHGAWIADALKPLVDDGTITQAQADAVTKALQDAHPDRGPGMFQGGPGHGFGPGGRLDAAATAIGIDENALREELASAGSLAAVARAHDVDPQKVIDALVADLESHLAEEVQEGHITQAQADEIDADAADRMTQLVNGELPAPPVGGFGWRHEGDPGSSDTTTPDATPDVSSQT